MKKIDIYVNGKYYASTNSNTTCKAAVQRVKHYLQTCRRDIRQALTRKHGDLTVATVKAYFDHKYIGD